MLKWLPGLVVVALGGSAVFLGGLHVFFPGTAAVERMRWEVQDRTDGKWGLAAKDADLWWATGVAVDEVTLFRIPPPARRARKGEPEAPPVPVPVLQADRVGVRVQILPLIKGARMASFAADLYGGDVSGEAGRKGDVTIVRIDGSDLDLARVPFDGEGWSVDTVGKADIDFALALDMEKVKDSEGHLRIAFQGLAIQDGTFGATPLTELSVAKELLPLSFGKATLAMEVEDGSFEVTEGTFTAGDIEATLSGSIGLHKDPERWRLRLSLTLQLPDELDTLARLAPSMKNARDEDGAYHFSISGTPVRPRFREDRSRGRGGGLDAPPRIRGGGLEMPGGPGLLPDRGEPPEGQEDFDPSADEEDRKQRRLERIRERRKKLRDGEPMRPEGAEGETERPVRRRFEDDEDYRDPDLDLPPIYDEDEGPLPDDPGRSREMDLPPVPPYGEE